MTKKENIPSIVSADSADMALDSEYNCSPLIFLPFLAKWETLPSREVGVSKLKICVTSGKKEDGKKRRVKMNLRLT